MTDVSVETRILIAWKKYQRTEKYGLAFGKVCYEWQHKFKVRGFRGDAKGEGIRPILDRCGIPHSTAYWWIDRYKESIGLKAVTRVPTQSGLPILEGTYRVLYVDPPWDYRNPIARGYGAAQNHYAVMSLGALCSMPLPRIADNAALFVWVTAPFLQKALDVVEAWKFRYVEHFVWDKVKHNFGHYMSVRHELLYICTRGSCLPTWKPNDSVFSIERTEHSRKPEFFRELIDRMYPEGPRVELFARGPLPSAWSGWGSEYEPVNKADMALTGEQAAQPSSRGSTEASP